MSYTYYRRYQPSRRRSGFKSFFWLVLFLVFFFLILKACVSVFSSFAEDKKDEAVLSVIKGNAEILEWGQSDAKSASDSELVLVGDQITTVEDSRLSLSFYNGTLVYLDENTKLKIAEFTAGESHNQMELQVVDGQIWVEHLAQDEGELELLIQTDVMNLQSFQGTYLVSNRVDEERVAVKSGQVGVDFVDRGEEELVIESLTIKEGEQSLLTDGKERALLARENISLVEPVVVEFWDTVFVEQQSSGEQAESEATGPIEIEEDLEASPEEVVVEETSLVISVSTPSSGATIGKDAFAIEGQIVSGTASKVMVTWSGNGQAYPLGLFTAGSGSFRYVADTDYANLSVGSNTYTIVAYDSEGNASNMVVLTIDASF
ncbi:hypothetical protein A3J23_04545 [Candidatus Peregrinibacteria bacterium RIFCSPLOWO2_02_FULL_48_14]|nr:MAG: hypothetical protein A3J23_04545 [Candidatus Peregrinibacteria bacterium RIFCSPLOWO2_02_FULL_48_14]